jgi:cell division protein FtsB
MDFRMTRRTTRRPASRAPVRRVAARRVTRRKESRALEFFRRWASTIFALAMFAVSAHLLFGDHGFLAMRRMKLNTEKLQQEVSAMEQDNQRLSGHIEALKTDPRVIERIARDEMGLARPGELIFRLPAKEKK